MALPVNGSTHLIPACYLFYRPRKDERLSWPSWLTRSGWLTHNSGHPSAAGRAQDRESSPARDRRSTTVPRHHAAAQDAGAVAELAAARKTATYAALESRYLFQPIAVESLGPINCIAVSFLSGLGRRIAKVSRETRDGSFLFQRLSVLIQRFNAVLLC